MDDIYTRLKSTGIRIESEEVVPCNGLSVALPYMVIRCESVITSDDKGRVAMEQQNYRVALFSREKDLKLERLIKLAMVGLGRIKIEAYPDGKPYETDFTVIKKSILR